MSISAWNAHTSLNDTLESVGEIEVLRRIFPRLPVARTQLLGPGDDAALVFAPDSRFVITTDMMVQGPDFRLNWSTPYDVGWKVAATNMADVAAMGAEPTGLLLALAAPPSTRVGVLEQIADGMRAACDALAPQVGVVGGDLSASPTVTLAVTAWGDLSGRAPVTRSAAAIGDTVAVAGHLGYAAAGLWLLTEHDGLGQESFSVQELRQRYPLFLGAQLRPSPPLNAGILAACAGATAMLDLSDGLLHDANRIAKASDCRIDFYSEALEREKQLLTATHAHIVEHAEDFLLFGGEDHALLATFPPESEIPEQFRIIGSVSEGSPGVTISGRPCERLGGWDPFENLP